MVEKKLKKGIFESENKYQKRLKAEEERKKKENYEKKLAKYDSELNMIVEKRSSTRKNIYGYELSINRQLDRLKKNPGNKSTLAAVTRLLQQLYAKKLLCEKYSDVLENKEAELKVGKRELLVSRGESVIDNDLLEKFNEEIMGYDDVMNSLNETDFNLRTLFSEYENSSLLSGSLKEEINEQVMASLSKVVPLKKDTNTTNTTNNTVSNVSSEEIQQILNSYNN